MTYNKKPKMILFDVGETLFNDGKCNLSGSKINGNIIIYYKEDNNETGEMDKLFVDAESGNYKIKDIDKIRKEIPDFENIPLEQIGKTSK